MTDAVFAIDIGTTGVRGVTFNRRDGSLSEQQYLAFPDNTYRSPEAGQIEMDPELLWSVVEQLLKQQYQQAQDNGLNVKGLSLTTQRSSVLCWDSEGKPLHWLIPWNCTRSREICDEMNSSMRLAAIHGGASVLLGVTGSDKFRAGSCFRFSTLMAATRLSWVLRNVPGAQELADAGRLRYGGIDSWIVWRLTGGTRWATDLSLFSATGLYDPWTGAVNSIVTSMLQIPTSCLPPILPTVSSDHLEWGRTSDQLYSIPILSVSSDQGAAAAGARAFHAGDCKVTLGTGGFVTTITGSCPANRIDSAVVQYPCFNVFPIVAYCIDGVATYTVEGQCSAFATSINFAGTQFGLWSDVATSSALASSVPHSNGAHFVPGLYGLRAPHNCDTGRAAFVGLSSSVTRAHLVRAVLEGVTWRVAENIALIDEGKTHTGPVVRVNGGCARSDFIMQFLADVSGKTVVRGRNAADGSAAIEGSVYGAISFAGVALQWWNSLEDAPPFWTDDETFKPSMSQEEREARYIDWMEAVEMIL